MLFKRLQVANKKAQKRWDFYHKDSDMPTPFGIGVYRKRKGCECAGCSRRKQDEKKQRVLSIRRETIEI